MVINYEPHSLSTNAGPRESPEKGLQSYSAQEEGPKQRTRSDSFADHYSQARQFFISQTEVEQKHIALALKFELSEVQTLAIRARMVSHLLNIDAGLAGQVAEGLRLREMPRPADAARPTLQDLKPLSALSIQLNWPRSFADRKVGALITDGVDAKMLDALAKALKAEGAMLKLVAPEVGGVEASDGTWYEADESLDGGPSVLFDAVAILQGPRAEL
jgi:catalase